MSLPLESMWIRRAGGIIQRDRAMVGEVDITTELVMAMIATAELIEARGSFVGIREYFHAQIAEKIVLGERKG